MSTTVPQPRSWLWLQGLACGAALSVAPGPALLVVVLLMPGLLAWFVERPARKPRSESMLLLGLATVFLPLRLLWDAGATLSASVELLSDPSRVALSWTAAAAGWLFGELAQVVTQQVSDLATRRRMTLLRREREELAAEWGLPDPPAPRRR